MTIEQVKALGNRVRITHLRTVDGTRGGIFSMIANTNRGLYTSRQIKQLYGPSASPGNRGGITIVQVETPSGQVLLGEAKCSDKDNFNKKLGIQIALGRAMTSGE